MINKHYNVKNPAVIFLTLMKMPERSRTSCIGQVLLPKWCHFVTSHDGITVKSDKMLKLPENHIFSHGDLDLWPMTLTTKLNLFMLQADLHVKFHVRMSNNSAVRAQTHRQRNTQKDMKTSLILWPRPLTQEVNITMSYYVSLCLNCVYFYSYFLMSTFIFHFGLKEE